MVSGCVGGWVSECLSQGQEGVLSCEEEVVSGGWVGGGG
jgi:hypothetical protein